MSTKKNIVCPFCFADCTVDVPEKSSNPFPVQYCGRCHSQIPADSLGCRLFPIAVVGPSGSGKTHFLTVLAHLLCEGALWPTYWTATRVIRRSDPGAEGRSSAGSDDEFVTWEEKLYPQKSASGTILAQTDQRSETAPPLSLVIHLSYESKSLANRVKEPYRKKDILLAFTDTAGEDLTHMGWDAVARKYPIFGRRLAEGLIALVNPTQLSAVKDECNSGNPVLKGKYEQSGLVLSAFATLQSVLSIPEVRKSMKRKPLAVCLTKTDALVALDKLDPQDYLAGTQDIVCREPADEGRIRLSELKDLSSATATFMAEMDGDSGFQEGRAAADGIAGSASLFKYRAFFATDALGSAIQTARRVGSGARMFSGRPVPRRVLDPLLWILWQHGLVGSC